MKVGSFIIDNTWKMYDIYVYIVYVYINQSICKHLLSTCYILGAEDIQTKMKQSLLSSSIVLLEKKTSLYIGRCRISIYRTNTR